MTKYDFYRAKENLENLIRNIGDRMTRNILIKKVVLAKKDPFKIIFLVCFIT